MELLIIFIVIAIILTILKSILNKLGDILTGLRKNSIREIDSMSGLEFENFLADLFKDKGYNVEVTSGSRDQGADLIIEKNRRRIAVQAKRYKGKVGNSAIQEILGAVRYYDCHIGRVITNSEFTNSAIELAEYSGVELWDRNKLLYEINNREKEEDKGKQIEYEVSYSNNEEENNILKQNEVVFEERETVFRNDNTEYIPGKLYSEAESLRKADKVEEAEKKYLKSIRIGEEEYWDDEVPPPAMYRELAKLYYHTGRDKKAINILERYLSRLDTEEDDIEMKTLKERMAKKDFRRLTYKYSES